MITLRYGPLSIGEAFFVEPSERPAVDILRCRQVAVPDGLRDVEEQATLTIDLGQTTEEIYSKIEAKSRYEIRRASEKDGIHCSFHESDEASESMIHELAARYREFASGKGIASLNLMRLLQLRTAGVLFISRAFAADGAPLVWHVHLLSNQRARLLYSLSLFRDNEDTAWRGMVGRANRLLHWNDLQAFQARGACIYDFGGYYRGTEDSAKLRINKFKSEFGGVLRVEYNGVRFLSLAGKAMAWVYRLRTASVNRRARQTAA